MPKFTKRPQEIEAEQYLGTRIRGVCIDSGTAGCDSRPHLHTIHKDQTVILAVGDWVIQELDGEHFYPCKPDIFEATYEAVSD